MGTVTLLVPGPAPSPHRKCTMVFDNGKIAWTVPLLAAVGIDEAAGRWAFHDRPGLVPLGTWAGMGATEASITIRLGNDQVTSVEFDLAVLRSYSHFGRAVIVSVGQLSAWSWTGAWLITSMQIQDQVLIQGSNDVCQATVTIGLKAALTPEQTLTSGK